MACQVVACQVVVCQWSGRLLVWVVPGGSGWLASVMIRWLEGGRPRCPDSGGGFGCPAAIWLVVGFLSVVPAGLRASVGCEVVGVRDCHQVDGGGCVIMCKNVRQILTNINAAK